MTTGSAYAEAGQFTNAASPQKEPVILCSSQKLKNEYLSGLKGYELRTLYRERGAGFTVASGFVMEGRLRPARFVNKESDSL